MGGWGIVLASCICGSFAEGLLEHAFQAEQLLFLCKSSFSFSLRFKAASLSSAHRGGGRYHSRNECTMGSGSKCGARVYPKLPSCLCWTSSCSGSGHFRALAKRKPTRWPTHTRSPHTHTLTHTHIPLPPWGSSLSCEPGAHGEGVCGARVA
jgi:hypothetical protein